MWQLERRHSYTGNVSLGREDCLVETESFNIIGKWMHPELERFEDIPSDSHYRTMEIFPKSKTLTG